MDGAYSGGEGRISVLALCRGEDEPVWATRTPSWSAGPSQCILLNSWYPDTAPQLRNSTLAPRIFAPLPQGKWNNIMTSDGA